jgi:CheY-like chemotaxis protein
MKNILLVEDHPGIALALGVRLKSMGYSVTTAADAATAVTRVCELHPDVVVLDIGLPAGDGFLVSERISRLSGDVATPIIYITASQQPGLRERAMKGGAAAFLQKPFDANCLADAIEIALAASDAGRPRDEAVGATG